MNQKIYVHKKNDDSNLMNLIHQAGILLKERTLVVKEDFAAVISCDAVLPKKYFEINFMYLMW